MEQLENAIMEALLAGDDPRIVGLRQQYAAATVKGREFSGVGFFTNFQVPSTAPRVSPPDFELGAHTLLQARWSQTRGWRCPVRAEGRSGHARGVHVRRAVANQSSVARD